MRLETPRLILSPHTVDDFDDLSTMWADEAVFGPIGLPRPKPADSWARLLRYAGLWTLLGFGYWTVRERDTGAYVGDVGFGDFYRDVVPAIRGIPEAGWAITRIARGRGYAREAMSEALGWLDTRIELSVCLIASDNAPSLRLAASLGYGQAQDAQSRTRPALMLWRQGGSTVCPPGATAGR
jgi:RimJ/RimL family protein N-acetyltransferase